MIAAGGNRQVAVTITTGTLAAIAGAKMTITDSAAASPQKLPLTAKVVALPACAATTSGSFTYTNHMLATWRTNHTATTLKNGNVLLVGGFAEAVSSVPPGAEIFNFKTCTYSLPAVNTPNGRVAHTATLLNNGQVLIAGGEVYPKSGGSEMSASAEIFNPKAHHGRGAFAPTGSMHYAREYHAATLLANGKVLITGGNYTADAPAEIYNPATGTFSVTSVMNFVRLQHTATLLSNGKVLIAGGNGASTVAELFDPALDGGVGGFTALKNEMNYPRLAQTATPLTIGYDAGGVLLAGGYSTGISNGRNDAEVFEPFGSALFVETPNLMSVGRMSATASALLDGNVLVAGGTCNTSATGAQNSADMLMISGPDIGNFEPTGSLNDALVGHAAALLPDGQVLITGGWRFTGCFSGTPCGLNGGCFASATNNAELYHP